MESFDPRHQSLLEAFVNAMAAARDEEQKVENAARAIFQAAVDAARENYRAIEAAARKQLDEDVAAVYRSSQSN